MSLGGGPGEWDDYEWFDLADVPVDPLDAAVDHWLASHPVWTEAGTSRVLLVDLDNLRADAVRWRVRMAAMVAIARQSDHAYFAGQRGALRRAKPRLAEFAGSATGVPDGSDLADLALLDALAALGPGRRQVTVASNDNIFADLADDGPLAVISPGRDALSAKLRRAADLVIDLESLEAAAAAATAAARPPRRRGRLSTPAPTAP